MGCQKEEEFNTEPLPGDYVGSLIYWTGNGINSFGSSVPEFSKLFEYKTTIRKSGSRYVLSFDKSFHYNIPDITVEISSNYNSDIVAIKTVDGQAYTSVVRDYYLDYPNNFFQVNDFPGRVDCNLTVKSINPDSTSFLQFILIRTY